MTNHIIAILCALTQNIPAETDLDSLPIYASNCWVLILSLNLRPSLGKCIESYQATDDFYAFLL